jgi:hypothetical protein
MNRARNGLTRRREDVKKTKGWDNSETERLFCLRAFAASREILPIQSLGPRFRGDEQGQC